MSDQPHLTHSSWPLFHLTFSHTHRYTHPPSLTSPPCEYHSPLHHPSSSPICYQLSGTNQPWYSPLALTSVCSGLSMLSGPGGTGRAPPYQWCHQIKRWDRGSAPGQEETLSWAILILSCRVFGIWIESKSLFLTLLWIIFARMFAFVFFPPCLLKITFIHN